MKSLYQLFCIAKCQVLSSNIPISENISVESSARMTRAWGNCSRYGERYVIKISTDLLQDGVKNADTLNTIVHELLHTCPNCMNHGEDWKHWARIASTFGWGEITRANRKPEVERMLKKRRKYAVYCPKCGIISYVNENQKIFQHPADFRCGACHTNGSEFSFRINTLVEEGQE